MSTATPIPTREGSSVVLYDVSWEEYRNILEGRGDRKFHHTYDNGVLEIMSPLVRHEARKKFLAQVVEAIGHGLNLDFLCLGSATHKRKDLLKGLEPDECFYFASEPTVRDHHEEIDFDVDPPPDLAIEIDITHSSIKRRPIYAALGVPELWIVDGKKVSILLRDESGLYQEHSNGLVFPFLKAERLTELLNEVSNRSQAQRIRDFADWAVKESRNG